MTNSQTDHKDDAKFVTIIVNGRERPLRKDDISYDEVVHLALDPVPSGPNIVITVTYRRGHGNKPEGTMVTGDEVKVKEGMIFNVTATDKG